MRVLIAGVGHPFLRDLSVGPVLVPELRRLDWPAGIEVDDWSFNPIAIVQRLEERPGFYDRIVLFAGVERGREPGRVSCYRWDGKLPDAETIQGCVAESVMGIISLDNLLIVGQQFGAFPPDVVVVEVEPQDTGWGADFTPRIDAALGEFVAAVRRAALEGAMADPLDAVRRRDELLQVLYWYRGEGLGESVAPHDLTTFLGVEVDAVRRQLDGLVEEGYAAAAEGAPGRYRLTEWGAKEGGRRFADEFAGLTGQAHGECRNPNCSCQTLGPEACESRTAHAH